MDDEAVGADDDLFVMDEPDLSPADRERAVAGVGHRAAPSPLARLELAAVRAMVEDLEPELAEGLVVGLDVER